MTLRNLSSYYASRAVDPVIYPALDGDRTVNVCVVGAGFTGLGAALTLARAGVDTLVVEAGRVGAGASGVNGGQVHPGQRRDQAWLERKMGEDSARQLWTIAEDARLWLGELMTRYQIDCDYHPGLLLLAHRQGLFRDLAADAEHLASRYGVTGLEVLDEHEVKRYTHMQRCHGGVFNPHGGHLDPLALARGLAAAATQEGAALAEMTRVTSVTAVDGRGDGPRWRVETPEGTVHAHSVIMTGDGTLGALSGDTAAHVLPLVNFMIATEPLGALADEVLSAPIAASDTRHVVNYFRRTGDGRLIFGGGESYGSDLPANFADRVRDRMIDLYPQLREARITHGWGGTLGITATRMPFVRMAGQGLYIASGYSGQGVMLGPYTGRIMAEAIVGEPERFELLTRLPTPPLPGGRWLRRPLLVAAMIGFGLLDRL